VTEPNTRTAAPASAWSLRFDYQDLAELLDQLAVEPTSLSPVKEMVARARRSAAAPAASTGIDGPAARLALRVLAAPSRLLMLATTTPAQRETAWFLVGGDAVVRFDLGTDGGRIITSAWSSAGFGQALARHLGLPPAAAGPRHIMTFRFLLAIRECVDAGLGTRPLDESLVVEALRRCCPATVKPSTVKEALIDDGVLVTRGRSIDFAADWLAAHRYLVGQERVELCSIELDDAAERIYRQRTLCLLGVGSDRRIGVLPASTPDSLDDLLALAPATAELVATVAGQLAGPPWSPPTVPARGPALDARGWLSTAARPDATQARWNRSTPEELVASPTALPGAARAPSAVLRPRVIVETQSRRRLEASTHRIVYALDDGGGAVWRQRGSTIEWRAMDPAAVRSRLAELLGSGGADTSSGPVALSLDDYLALVGAPDPAAVQPRPDSPIAGLEGDLDLEWLSIRVLAAGPERIAGAEYLLARSRALGLWSFELVDDTMWARPIQPPVVLDDIADALIGGAG
jgi:hypothetical protein